MLSNLDKGSSPFWNVSKILKKKSKNIPILNDNTATYTSQQEKCEILAQNFSLNHTISANLSDPSTSTQVDNVVSSLHLINPIPASDYLVSTVKIKNIIKHLKTKKAPGIDGVNNRCLKALPGKGVKYLTLLINACLRFCYFPQTWKKSKVVPILKPSKPSSNPSSYRPISLLSSVSKLLEKVIKEKLTDFINTNNILPNHQFGFRNEHNTVQPLIRIRNLVHTNFKDGKSTGMILLDIKAAFDSVWHNGLIFKMSRLNFPTEIIKIIQSYLTERYFTVYIGSTYSQQRSIPAGCPQGSCLSPILYNIFTADFPVLNECKTSIFADDTAILCSEIYAADIIFKLQEALKEIHEYFTRWKIIVNTQKTQAIYFTRRRKPCFLPQGPFRFNNNDITWDNNAKYLGVILDQKLKYKDHIPYIIDKINKITRIMFPLINRNSKLNINNKILICKAIFHAIMFYASPVWATTAHCHVKKLQIAQNTLLKMIYNLPWHFSTQRIHALANIELVNVKIDRLTSNFNTRCLTSDYGHINELISA